eukprot:m.335140 g.335140  ORF g.335140 m.335140 type:complete len:95 (+) comp55676_c0_seq29:1322-1606(+)
MDLRRDSRRSKPVGVLLVNKTSKFTCCLTDDLSCFGRSLLRMDLSFKVVDSLDAVTLAQIRVKNRLDVELYAYAKRLFARRIESCLTCDKLVLH